MRHTLLLHFVVVIFGFTGVLGKLISIPALDLVWWRMLIASFGILLYVVFSGKTLRVNGGHLVKYLGTGFLICAHWVTFFEAIKRSNVSVALVCLSSAAFLTALLEPLIYRRRIVGYEVGLGLLVVAGLSLIFKLELSYRLGMLIALLSAFLVALFSVINGRLMEGGNPLKISFYEMLGGWFGATLYLALNGRMEPAFFTIATSDLVYLMILGLVCTSFAFVAAVSLLKHFSPFTIALVINMEPIYGIAMALLFFGESERMSSGFYAGSILIVLAIYLNALMKKRRNRLVQPLPAP